MANFFCKGPDGKYFKYCGTRRLWTTLLLPKMGSSRQYGNKQVWCVPIKFTYTQKFKFHTILIFISHKILLFFRFSPTICNSRNYTETGSMPDQAVCRLLFEIIMLTINWFSFILTQIIKRQLPPSYTLLFLNYIKSDYCDDIYGILFEKQVSYRRIKMSTPLSAHSSWQPLNAGPFSCSHQSSLLLLMHSILGRITTSKNLLLPTLSPLSLLWMLNASRHHPAQNASKVLSAQKGHKILNVTVNLSVHSQGA